MQRILAGTLACAVMVPLLTSCATKRTQRDENQAVAVSAQPLGKETGATVRNAIMGAQATGPAATTIARQMDKQAQELAFELPGAVVQRLGSGIVVILPEGMLFAQESDELASPSRDNLRRLATRFETYPNTRIMIVGHTDTQGGTDRNQSLSERRAQSVRDHLGRLGADGAKMTVLPRGALDAKGTNEPSWSQDRRVDFTWR